MNMNQSPDTGGIGALLPSALSLGLARQCGDVRELPAPEYVGQVRHRSTGHTPHHIVGLHSLGRFFYEVL